MFSPQGKKEGGLGSILLVKFLELEAAEPDQDEWEITITYKSGDNEILPSECVSQDGSWLTITKGPHRLVVHESEIAAVAIHPRDTPPNP